MIQPKKLTRAQKAFQTAFIQLMSEKTYDSITVADIVRKSDYSRRTFYAYYQDKYDFIQKMIDNECAIYSHIICDTIASKKEIVLDAPLYKPALVFFQHVYRHQDLYHFIINDKIPFYTLDMFCNKANDYFKETLSLKMAPGVSPDLNNDFYFYIGTNTYILYIKFWEMNQFRYSPEYMAQQVTYMIKMKQIVSVQIKGN